MLLCGREARGRREVALLSIVGGLHLLEVVLLWLVCHVVVLVVGIKCLGLAVVNVLLRDAAPNNCCHLPEVGQWRLGDLSKV